MPNAFETELGIPLPQCCSTGDCCKGASPSTPFHRLLERAATGDDFAQGFFSIMIPYPTHEDARRVVPGLVERTLRAAEKSPDFPNNAEDVVFYHCRYLLPNNRCGVHEDRPQFCRDYPDTPFVVYAPGCAFEPWANACREKYNALKAETEQLSQLQEELAQLRDGGTGNTKIDDLSAVWEDDQEHFTLIFSLTDRFLVSPFTTFWF